MNLLVFSVIYILDVWPPSASYMSAKERTNIQNLCQQLQMEMVDSENLIRDAVQNCAKHSGREVNLNMINME